MVNTQGSISSAWARAVERLLRHPRALLLLAAMALGAILGWVIVNLALLVQPMRLLFLLLYTLGVPAALFSIAKNPTRSRRLWIGMLASVLGLLGMRLIYHDLLHLQLEPAFRSNLTGFFGLVTGITGFLRAR